MSNLNTRFFIVSEEMLNQFDIQMRRGLISFLVLSILRENSYHGYKIIEEIKSRTHGFWSPPSSTIYPLLKRLKGKGLIKQVKDIDPNSTKKIYELTREGKKALDKMDEIRKQRQQKIRSFLSNLDDTSNENDFLFPNQFGMGKDPESMKEEILEGLSDTQKIRMLKNMKKLLQKGIDSINKDLEKLEK